MSTRMASLTVGSWNIGGGILGASHQLHGTAHLDYHISRISEWAPDVICLQEAHEFLDGSRGQAEAIASAVGYKNVHTVAISPSHLDQQAMLSLSVMSNYQISNARYTQFPNPDFTSKGPNGEQWVLFDKGYVTVDLTVEDVDITLVNAHCFPLHYFGVTATDSQFSGMWTEFSNYLIEIAQNKSTIAVIDLNYEPIEDVMGKVFTEGPYKNSFTRTPTIPKGIQQDYILYASPQLELEQTAVTPTDADHHYCEARVVL